MQVLNVLLCANPGQSEHHFSLSITMRIQVDGGGRMRYLLQILTVHVAALQLHRPEAPHHRFSFQTHRLLQQFRESALPLVLLALHHLESTPRRFKFNGSTDWLLLVVLRPVIMSPRYIVLLYERVVTTRCTCVQRKHYQVLRFSLPGLARHGMMPARRLRKTIRLLIVS